MKLLKKLLPIASVASVAAVVTPLTVSCGKGVSNNFDYIPTIAPHEAVVFEGSDLAVSRKCTGMYFNDIKQNADIFVQDMCASFAAYEKEEKLSAQESVVITKWNFSLSIDKVNIEETTADLGEGLEYLYLVSFDFKISRDYSWYTIDTTQGYKNTITSYRNMDISATLVNVPYRVVYVEENGSWLVQPNYSNGMLLYLPDNIKMEAHGFDHEKQTVENKYGIMEQNDNEDINFLFDKVHLPIGGAEYIIRDEIQFSSYYLQNCSVA